ncbi:MAG: phenylalanine--tRNA ligase subunit beta [Candidatus Rokuibacteriota bacterium]|nr:MAG: phenylalanine--tRNA ligase subunit beta [Candidatus Rokubacteria bacterium]
MKIPYRWVGELVELDLSAAQAADRLINAGVEVASVTPLAPDFRGVVAGEIEAIERELGESRGHRLLLCRVSTGRDRYSVVCGAPNTKVGARAPFAPPGAVLPGERKIAAAKIHGVESQGMLCSERELGLGEEHEAGLLLLDDGVRPGADLIATLGLDDHLLEVEITPNRPDCLSVLGIARELAALTGARLRPPPVTLRESAEAARGLTRVQIEAPDLCHRFTVRAISAVTVGPSPAWLRMRLRAVGLRPISNVVDATNYVLWELGQPLHAYDAETVTDGTFVVRRARVGERFTTLDGQERTLDESMLLIADPKRAIGLAGVMGGANTEVTDRTTRILLESAWFDPASIRRTSRALSLRTAAAYRFERGADIEGLATASARAAALIAELAGGAIARGIVDAYPRRRKPSRVRLRMSRVKRVLGVAPPRAQVVRILSGLGLPVKAHGADLEVTVPSFRRDIAMEDDLVEEIIRVWGYDRLPSTLPGGAIALVTHPASLRQNQTVRRALVGAGLAEVVTHSFSDPARAALFRRPNDAAPVELLNPLATDASWLRVHPLEGVLGAIATNVRRQQPDVRVFEICKTYARLGTAAETGNANVSEPASTPRRPPSVQGGLTVPATTEPRWVTIALTGTRGEPGWDAGGAQADVYDAKGLAEHLLEALGLRASTGDAGALTGFEPDCHGTLVGDGGAILGEFGEVASTIRESMGISAPVFAAVVSLDTASASAPPLRYQALPRFPAVERDLAFVVGSEQTLTAAQIEAALRQEAGPLLRQLVLFDVFRFPDGRSSLAWRLLFQAEDRTLTDDEVNAIQDRLVQKVTGTFHITLRSV